VKPDQLDFLVKSTFSWAGLTEDGREFPGTPENVRKLYGDPRFKWLRDQVEIFVTRSGARHMSALRWYACLRENATAFPSREPHGLGEIIGQSDVVQRLMVLVDLARRGETKAPLRHILLIGPNGSGKRKIAEEVAWELGVKPRSADPSSIERPGDVAAIVNDLDHGDILLLVNVNQLRKEVVNVLPPAMSRFEMLINVGERSMTLLVKPFTVIGTALREADCPLDLRDSFDAVIQLQRYSGLEMLQLVERLAGMAGLYMEPTASTLIARLAEGNPGRAKLLVDRLIRLSDKTAINEQDARELLSIPAVRSASDANLAITSTDWNRLSGIEFERLIRVVLAKMGFTAEMTKASGDGGIDIEATLDRPIVGGRYLIQCKRFSHENLVGSPTIREFYGAVVADRKAVKGVLITTSAFTAHAREFAAGLPIELIDGENLATLLRQYTDEDESRNE
jgi:Holliday junction resolvasome RuvABC ATP-dependent DNA helicase subunit